MQCSFKQFLAPDLSDLWSEWLNILLSTKKIFMNSWTFNILFILKRYTLHLSLPTSIKFLKRQYVSYAKCQMKAAVWKCVKISTLLYCISRIVEIFNTNFHFLRFSYLYFMVCSLLNFSLSYITVISFFNVLKSSDFMPFLVIAYILLLRDNVSVRQSVRRQCINRNLTGFE